MNAKLRLFYTDVMNCDCTGSECPTAWKNLREGVVPRGFGVPAQTDVDILVVTKNPGHPLDGEKDFFRRKEGTELLAAKVSFDSDLRRRIRDDQNDRSLIYHRNLRRYLRYFLGIVNELESYYDYRVAFDLRHDRELHEKVAITPLFKCSTHDERERLSVRSVRPCYLRWFLPELKLIHPKLLLALGSEVERALHSRGRVDLPSLPVVTVKHPSYFYARHKEVNRLQDLRTEIQTIIGP